METCDDFSGPVNIGNPLEVSILDLAKKVIAMTGSKSQLVRLPLPVDDPRQRRPDISLAKEKLSGWEPKISLEEGLERTIAYFDNILSVGTVARSPSE
jgi:UDP-glucuronate decarboxylase